MSKSRNFKSSAPRRAAEEVPAGYAADPSAGKMLRFEASLPKLPVPPLASTAAKYLESVQPHLTVEEFSKTKTIVHKFVESDQAKELQKRLESRAADPNLKSWLADWWNDVAYMGYRDPVVVYVSYFYVHKDDVRKPGQAKRAAQLLKATLAFRSLVERSVTLYTCDKFTVSSSFTSKELEPEKIRGMPLAMSSYQWL
jgi:carnitine O-acetyltransferase